MRQLLFCLSLLTSTTVLGETLILSTAAGPPLTLKNQQGFIDQVVSEVLRRMGYTLKVSKAPAERALLNANSGVDDGDMYRIGGLGKKYPNLLQVSEKAFEMEFVAFTRKADLQITDWNSLQPYSVGIITGWKILEHNIPPNVALTKVKNTEQLFTLLQNDRVDIILHSKWQGLNAIRDHHYTGIRMLQPFLAKEDMFVYLNKKHQELSDRFSNTLREIKADGTYQRIYDQTLLPLIQHSH